MRNYTETFFRITCLMWYVKFSYIYIYISQCRKEALALVALNANNTKMRLSELQVLDQKMIPKSNSLS